MIKTSGGLKFIRDDTIRNNIMFINDNKMIIRQYQPFN
jgi:hypothetical protein